VSAATEPTASSSSSSTTVPAAALCKTSAGEKERQNHDMQLAHMILLALRIARL
jgi:hypothetical protein